MRLICPKCRTRKKAMFYRQWSVRTIYDGAGKEVDIRDPKWEKCFRCVRCNMVAVKTGK